MAHTCSQCDKGFTTLSNKYRHERSVHDDNESESNDSNNRSDDEKETSDEESDATIDDGINVWSAIIRHAAKAMNLTNAEEATREPYLSEMVNHMRKYAENGRQFVYALDEDPIYKTIHEVFKAYEESDNTDADELEEAIDMAWQNKRFRLKNVIHDNIDVIEEVIEQQGVHNFPALAPYTRQ